MEMNLHNFWRKILHVISVCGMYMIILGTLSLIQMFTIGLVLDLNKILFLNIPIFPLIYCLVSVFVIQKFFRISSPYK